MHCGSCPSYNALAEDAVRYEEERDRARAELERVSEDRDSWEQNSIMLAEINARLLESVGVAIRRARKRGLDTDIRAIRRAAGFHAKSEGDQRG